MTQDTTRLHLPACDWNLYEEDRGVDPDLCNCECGDMQADVAASWAALDAAEERAEQVRRELGPQFYKDPQATEISDDEFWPGFASVPGFRIDVTHLLP